MPTTRSGRQYGAAKCHTTSATAQDSKPAQGPLRTPDGRYIVVRARCWRCSNPSLPAAEREQLVHELMAARRAVQQAAAPDDMAPARARVHAAKCSLGERGPVWWSDGAPDYTRYLIKNTPYAEWYADQQMESQR